MLARRIVPDELPQPRRFSAHREPAPRPSGGWRRRGRQPTQGPGGLVQWWERPAPGGDDELWQAVMRCHEALHRRGMSVSELARRLHVVGWPTRRETLSKVLNGQQPTSWATVDRIAQVLDVDLQR